ncbi:two component response regulator [Neoasaia chiangmaiensis NBRC 101099]|uniref:DNA-binding response regulator n=1 Tax=Neoasaia chiangmaiensis TaxID=320497 RepID=A0A1U9KT03_9PROT|nr:response regulator transcription factor [Neoasaia chiangmaiensis]AQS88984.1 DNA-binding response regulator [Neoasaia chiangmaiensis]GBR40219.1 two component response regulator [Neoasaia chiangmaiensis NBRC 101099]GEN14005.1 DNA-binding response regulator [Neoasaia chiangmaiensis]
MTERKIRLVIVEDQAMLREAIVTLLSLEGDLQVVGHAPDGQAAYAMITEHQPDIVVTDIEMPQMSGIDLAEKLRREKARTQVMIVTTFSRAGYLKRALDAGVRGYLLKDSPITQLADAIRKVAAGGRAVAKELADAVWDAAPDPLNDRDRAILRMAEAGRSNQEIAEALSLSPGTIRNYFSETVQKLGARNRMDAGRIARRNGWL